MHKSQRMCKTAFVLTLTAFFITIFTIDPLPFGFYQLDTHCSHLVWSCVRANPGCFHIVSGCCIPALLFWKSTRAACEEPEWLPCSRSAPSVCFPQLLHTQALLSLIPLVSTCSLQQFILNKWGYKWDFVRARSLFLGALLLSGGRTWKLPRILIWMGFVGLNCLNVL